MNISGGSILGCGGGAKPTDGGAVEVQGGTLSITAGYLGGNQASTRGGAICVGKNSGKVTVNGKDAVISVLGMMVQAFNPRTWEAEAGRFRQVTPLVTAVLSTHMADARLSLVTPKQLTGRL